GGAVTIALTLLAVGVGHRGWALAGVAAAVGATQLAVGWVNDWLDADRDAAAGRTDKPVATGAIDRRTVGVAGLLSALAVPLLGLPFGPAATVCITLVGVFALLYDWPLKATALSIVPYLVAFGLLPAFVVLALPGDRLPPWWLVTAGALLGGGAHFANVLPDLADDAATGVRGLPHRLSAGTGQFATTGLLGAATVVLVFGPAGPPSWTGLTAVAVAGLVLPLGSYAGWRATQHGHRPVALFRSVLVVALMDVLLLILGGALQS
ncbi:MAG TPA: UbiA family prenyltransferase, partial [Actinoplanes sp.]|nr:UbiA family prenyltransferase [Actinoplanes sp.]